MPAWIGERLVLLLPHDDISSARGKPYLIIDPRNKFGTGAHPTTRICLSILEVIVHQEKSILDIGTGTGILAICATKLGAKDVVAIDKDFDACVVCKENIVRNRLSEKVRLVNGRVDALSEHSLFDIVIANLESDTLLGLVPDLKAHVKSDGFIVISGVPTISQSSFIDVLEKSSLTILSSTTQGDWAGFVVTPVRRHGVR